MIILDNTTRSLEVDLDGAVTTNQLPFQADFVDVTTTAYSPGQNNGTTNSTTAVTVVAAPAASTQRQVKCLTIYNADTVSAVVTIQYNDNGTLRTLVKITLAVGSTLHYTDGEGWKVTDTNGNVLGSSGGSSGANTALSNLASVAINAALIPGTTGALDFGSAGFPWKDFWLAGGSASPGTVNFRITGTPTVSRIITIPDKSLTIQSELLLHEGEGTSNAAAATTLDPFGISGLTVKDSLIVQAQFDAITQQTASVAIYNDTDGLNIVNLGLVLSAGDNGGFLVFIRPQQNNSKSIFSIGVNGKQSNKTVEISAPVTFTTDWTGSWNIGLRIGIVTAGGTFRYRWTIHKWSGQ